MSLFVDRCSLRDAQLLFDALQKATATVDIAGAAAWAYFRFVSGRTLKRRLECELSADAIRSGGKVRMIVTARAANVGLAKALVDREDTGLRVLTQAAEGFPESADRGRRLRYRTARDLAHLLDRRGGRPPRERSRRRGCRGRTVGLPRPVAAPRHPARLRGDGPYRAGGARYRPDARKRSPAASTPSGWSCGSPRRGISYFSPA